MPCGQIAHSQDSGGGGTERVCLLPPVLPAGKDFPLPREHVSWWLHVNSVVRGDLLVIAVC